MSEDQIEVSSFQDLLRRAQTGDSEAFGELTAPLCKDLRKHAERNMNRLSQIMSADDAVQDTLCKAWRSLHECVFESAERLRNWVLTILDHAITDLHRKHFGPTQHPEHGIASLDQEHGRTQSDRELSLAHIVPGAERSPASVAHREEQKRRIEQLLSQLPRQTALVLDMSIVRGMTSGQIARELGKTDAAVRKILFRGLRSCREIAARSRLGE